MSKNLLSIIMVLLIAFSCLDMDICVYASNLSGDLAAEYVSKKESSTTEHSSLCFDGDCVIAETHFADSVAVNIELQVKYIYYDKDLNVYIKDTDIVKTEGRQGYVKTEFQKDNCYVIYACMEVKASEFKEKLSIGDDGSEEEEQEIVPTLVPIEDKDVTPTPAISGNNVIGTAYPHNDNSGKTEKGLIYLEEDGMMWIRGYSGKEKTVSIPDTINYKKVVSIEEAAFQGSNIVTEIVLSDGIISIGNEAFYGCTKLAKINFSKRLEQIGTRAFQGCSSLKEISLPASIETIGCGAFACPNLENIYVEEGNKRYVVDGNCLLDTKRENEGDGVIIVAVAGDFIIPDYVYEIEEYTFSGNEKLVELELPDGIIKIGTGAFEECENLKRIELPVELDELGMRVFDNCRNLEEVIFKEGTTLNEIGAGAFAGCRKLKTIELPLGIADIKSALFYRCESLESIKIPDGVTEIGVMAFSRCTALTKVEIPASVTSIADSAFHECKNVTIYGTEGSAAQEYAVSHGIPFESVE